MCQVGHFVLHILYMWTMTFYKADQSVATGVLAVKQRAQKGWQNYVHLGRQQQQTFVAVPHGNGQIAPTRLLELVQAGQRVLQCRR